MKKIPIKSKKKKKDQNKSGHRSWRGHRTERLGQSREQMHVAQDGRARAENGSKDGAVKDRIARRRRN